MTEREERRRQVELSVVAVSSLVLAAGYGVVTSVDAARLQRPGGTAAVAHELAVTAAAPPAPGLAPAPAPAPRRRIVVRRSRPS